jgi:hypothetical protein
MGQVWLARDERSGLDVALKIVPREGKAAVRAEREAKAAAALRHPRCQRIYSLARDSGHVYIAYEYVPGRTMREALATGQLDDRRAIEISAQVLEALAHAHGRGVVHRDVKPSNVLLAEGESVDVRLLDFGLAQMAEFDTLTAFGDVPGTLGYVSPERLLGQPATEAADVWAVGVMLWESLTGRHPFRRQSLSETSRLVQAGAEPLEHARPDLPPRVHESVARALALSPARRPRAADLARELRSPAQKRSGGKGGRISAAAVPNRARALSVLHGRGLPAVLAAITTGWVAATLPFYPAGWALGLAIAAGALGAVAPPLGMAFALTSCFFPLANISLALAVVFALFAASWLALTWRDARSGLLFVAGPLLAPLAAFGFLPLVAQLTRGWGRRAAQVALAVPIAALVAGLRHDLLPFDGSPPPADLGLAGTRSVPTVAETLWQTLASQPSLLALAGVLAGAAAALPYLRGRGVWSAAAFGAALLAATALAAPALPLLPLVAAAWVTSAFLALPRDDLD